MCKILIDNINQQLVEKDTGLTLKPSCFVDLAAYHSYLCQRGHKTYADSILEQVFEGEKVITKMIEYAQKARPGK